VINGALQKLVVNVRPAVGGVVNALPDSLPAPVSQVVGLAILLSGLLFSGSAKPPLQAQK
jgi:hypothetical protein